MPKITMLEDMGAVPYKFCEICNEIYYKRTNYNKEKIKGNKYSGWKDSKYCGKHERERCG